MKPRRGWTGIVVLLTIPALSACGELQERSLCRQYEDVRSVEAEIRDLDPAVATGDDVVSVVDDMIGELDQLQAASDGVYDAAVSELRASLTEFRQVAFALTTGEIDAARPLLEDSWERVIEDYQVLTQRLDVACTTD